MNAVRRKALMKIANELENLRVQLEDLQAEEEEYRDNMPENLWGSSRYEAAEEAIDNMTEAVSGLEDVYSYIVEATN